MNDTLNLKVKFRESFRPFAPAVPREEVAGWFALDQDSPYMLMVAPVTRPGIPAVTHVDGSARVQTVHSDTQPRFHRLLARFHARTGCPVLVNTSFNVRGEPLVCTPEDAFRCFMGTRIELLVAGRCLLRKAEQDPALVREYHQDFEPD
jgi:carbamoyltransferase